MRVGRTNKPDRQPVPVEMASNVNTMITSRPVNQYTGQSLDCSGVPIRVGRSAMRQAWNLALFRGSGNETFLASRQAAIPIDGRPANR